MDSKTVNGKLITVKKKMLRTQYIIETSNPTHIPTGSKVEIIYRPPVDKVKVTKAELELAIHLAWSKSISKSDTIQKTVDILFGENVE